MNSGSVESLNPSSRCGFNPNAFQIRPTVDFDSPDFSAMLARDQWVAFFGVDSRVSTMSCSTWSILTVAGRPGLGSSTSPSKRCSMKRERHLPTVGNEIPSRRATSELDTPVAHSSTIRDRSARSCADLRRRTQRCSCSRSLSVSVSSANEWPRCAMPQILQRPSNELKMQDTSPIFPRPSHQSGHGSCAVMH